MGFHCDLISIEWETGIWKYGKFCPVSGDFPSSTIASSQPCSPHGDALPLCFCFGKDHLAGGTQTVLQNTFFFRLFRERTTFLLRNLPTSVRHHKWHTWFASFEDEATIHEYRSTFRISLGKEATCLTGSAWWLYGMIWLKIIPKRSKRFTVYNFQICMTLYDCIFFMYYIQWNEQFHNRCFVLVDYRSPEPASMAKKELDLIHQARICSNAHQLGPLLASAECLSIHHLGHHWLSRTQDISRYFNWRYQLCEKNIPDRSTYRVSSLFSCECISEWIQRMGLSTSFQKILDQEDPGYFKH